MITNLITYLTELDRDTLLFLNSFHSDAIDPVMLLLTNKWLWIPLGLLVAAAVVHKGGLRKGLLAILCLGLAIAISDQVCSSLLRPIVERMRPSNIENSISSMVHVVNDYRGGRFGFPSAHASTTITVALFLAIYFKHRSITLGLLAWSMLLCYTRIYLGVHYPGDIVVGLIIGTASTFICYRLYLALSNIKLPEHIHFPFRPTTWP